jgi:Na+/melibiose symporter-like transporter
MRHARFFNMFYNSHFDRVRQLFADQFLASANGIVYRKGQKGAPVRVSERERDEFVATFNKRIRYAAWSLFPATVGLILFLVWLTPDAESASAQMAMWVGIAAILAPFIVIFYWAWNAPSRELERRTPEGAALTKEEARALAFSKITYGQLALAALTGMVLIWKMSTKTDVIHGWGVVWLVFGAALIVLAGVQAIRKWRFSQQ